MNKDKETVLEEISDKVNNFKSSRHLPIFEVYVSLYSILMALMLFWFPDMFAGNVIHTTNLYLMLLKIIPQSGWAFLFLIAGLIKSIGLLIDNNIMRIIGLLISSVIYAVFCAVYAIFFPSIGFLSYLVMTIFVLISISTVKSTGIRD